ncbi:hypothetical protein Q4E40_08630 [Pontibacter sp. BT731]|uniref:hypothetical protein n=1 Tax=Pontibacter coccineus TaxID=3063328 RepID=UPI0026E395A0|nr:hypothetical protein [Pontibacter sp. BT731]MDO6390189.1 hypothetical protein [Pontibacter sp. BT731]
MANKIIRTEIPPAAPVELRHMMGDLYVTIQRKQDYIEAKWQGHITADNVVCAAQAFLELLRKDPCPKLLNDKSEVTGDWQEANDWLQFEWLPQVLGAGLRYMAHVYSFSMFSKLAARELEERITPQLSMKNFYERRLAVEWLLEQDDTAAGQRAATA